MREHLLMTAFRILGILTAAALTPFFTIWIASYYRSYQRKKNEGVLE